MIEHVQIDATACMTMTIGDGMGDAQARTFREPAGAIVERMSDRHHDIPPRLDPYRAVFDAIDVAVCVIERLPLRPDGRRDYRYLAMNTAMQQMFGIGDLSGQTIRDNFPDEVEDWYDDYDRVLDTGEAIRFERESVPQELVLEMSVIRLEDASRRSLLVAMQDVTRRRRAEEAVRESEERFRLLVTASFDIVYRMNPDWTSMHALEGKSFLASTSNPLATWLDDYIPHGDRALVQAAIAEAIRSKTPFELEHRVHRVDGTIGWTFSRAIPLLNERGDIVEWFGTASDITERKLAEAAVRRSEEQLKEADRRKDEFLAMLAHELRNPLAPIRTGLELIRVAGNTPAAVERVRSLMDRQVAHMVRLIDDLLDVSRITSGKIQLQREPAPLNGIVASAVEANRTAIAAKQIDLVVDLPGSPCVLDVDPTRFVQVISNLLHNATKFTDAGGTIRIGGAVNDVDSTATRELTLSVSDSGSGISPEFLPRAFDLFAQGDTSHPGLGIGLALARRLVEMHGGTIDVLSEGPDRGSEFVIRLPVSNAPLPERPADSTDSDRIDCRVMVIDDNRDAASTLAMLVEELGGECRSAYDGESGLREVLRYRPDVVLLDIGMAGPDGYEICRRIRQQIGDDVMLVAVTGFGQQQDKDEAHHAGFNAHLTKPADLDRLKRLLARCRPVEHR